MTERGEPQRDCDHRGEALQSLAEYLKLHPSEAERVKALASHKDQCIPNALSALLRGATH